MESRLQSDSLTPIAPASLEARPYAPSYVDRLMNAVQRLPLPYWVTYVAAALLLALLNHVIAWADGWLPAFTLHPLLLTFPIWFFGPLGLMTYLNGISRAAFDQFRPLLRLDERDLARLKYEFRTMPARNVFLASIGWALVFIAITLTVVPLWAKAFGVSAPYVRFVVLQGAVTYFVGSAIYYHSFRQLRLVDRTVRTVPEFDLFRLEPVYAFSRLTARTGIAWMALFSFSLIVFPIELMHPIALTTFMMQILLAVAAFVLPLQVVHQRLVAGKRRLLADLDQRLKATLDVAHAGLDRQEFGQMEQLASTMAVLHAEREVLSKLPTWPWRAETLRGFVSAIAVPILLLLAQLALERLLN